MALLLAAALCGPAAAVTITLQEALAAARVNLDVSIAGRAAEAAQADVVAADHAPLPQLSAKLSQIDLQNGIGPGNPLTAKRIDKGVGLDWTWERGGKRALRTEAARRGAAAAEADVEEVRLQQLLATHVAWFDLLAAQERIVQIQAVERSALQTLDAVNRRLQAGDVAVQDAARVRIEAERARADADAAQHERRRAQTALAQLTGRDADAAELQAQPGEALPSALPAVPPLETLLDRRADVRAAAERVRAAEAGAAGADALKKNDVTWGASVDHYPGTSTRLLELRMAVPLNWGYRYEGESGRARAQLAQARDALEKTRRAAAAELARLRSDLEAAAALARRYEAEIVPRANDVAARAELAYGKGATSLTDLLEARRTQRAVLLEALAARIDLAKAQGAWQLRTEERKP